MIIPNERSHPYGCYLCGWARFSADEACLCDDIFEDGEE